MKEEEDAARYEWTLAVNAPRHHGIYKNFCDDGFDWSSWLVIGGLLLICIAGLALTGGRMDDAAFWRSFAMTAMMMR